MQKLLLETQTKEASAALAASLGDDAAAQRERFIELTLDSIFKRCYVRLGNQPDAEDAAQDCAVRLLDSASDFKPDQPLEGWIAWHVQISCSRLRRKQKSQLRRKEVYASMQNTSLSDFTSSVEENVMLREQSERLRHALLQLKDVDREIIELHYFDGLSQIEIADALRVKENIVSVRMHRARSRLRKILGQASKSACLLAAPSMLQAAPTISLTFQQTCLTAVGTCGATTGLLIKFTLIEKAIYFMKTYPLLITIFVALSAIGVVTAADASAQENADEIQVASVLDYTFPNSLDDYYSPEKLPMEVAYDPNGDEEYKIRNRKMLRHWFSMAKTMEYKYKLAEVDPSVHEGVKLNVSEMLSALVRMSPTEIHYRVDGFIPFEKTVPLHLKGKSIRDVLDLYDLQYKSEGNEVIIMPPEATLSEKLGWYLWKDELLGREKYWNFEGGTFFDQLSERTKGQVRMLGLDALPDPALGLSASTFVTLMHQLNENWSGEQSLKGLLELLSVAYGLKCEVNDRELVISKGGRSVLELVNDYRVNTTPVRKLSVDYIRSLPEPQSELDLIENVLISEAAINMDKTPFQEALSLLSTQTGFVFACSPGIEERPVLVNVKGENVSYMQIANDLAEQASAEIVIFKGIIIFVPSINAGG